MLTFSLVFSEKRESGAGAAVLELNVLLEYTSILVFSGKEASSCSWHGGFSLLNVLDLHLTLARQF